MPIPTMGADLALSGRIIPFGGELTVVTPPLAKRYPLLRCRSACGTIKYRLSICPEPWEATNLTDRQVLALTGVFYLLAFPLYGGGQFLLQDEQRFIGLGLVLMNSAVVIAIGCLLKPIIGRSSPKVAATVLWGRVIEGIVLGAGAIAFTLFAGSQVGESLNEAAYQIAMIILSAAGIVFSMWLFTERRVPPVLSIFGVIGYASLATAMVLERVGQDSFSMSFLAIAGVFELAFALWIIVCGFRPSTPSPVT